MTEQDQRLQLVHHWLSEVLSLQDYHLQVASSDASFRRYFRLSHSGQSYIVMDAPPDKENSKPFVDIASFWTTFGLNVPDIIEQDLGQGLLLLSDLGDTQYLQVLDANNVDRLYGDAINALISLQASDVDGYAYPPYDYQLLINEMNLFRDWLMDRHLNINLSGDDQQVLDRMFDYLANSALQQPQVPVHRDFHSRNLMLVADNNPGILDFQDAVLGPVTYDLVSLLRDCYIAWPQQQVEQWVRDYHARALQFGVLREDNLQQFMRWFDLMGVQRHLKAAGIFARLYHRDHKPGYLQDIPTTVGYMLSVIPQYAELQPLSDLLEPCRRSLMSAPAKN